MKKILFVAIAAASAALFLSCNKAEEEPELDPKVAVNVTDVKDNKATVIVSLTQGKNYKVKAVSCVRKNQITVDLSSEIQRIKYVEDNGTVLTNVPDTSYFEKLRADNEYVSLAISYDKEGRANSSAMVTFTAKGNPEGISDQNDAGKLDENVL